VLAYDGTGLTAEEIWEEVICDSLGDMNIFAKTTSEATAQELLQETKKSAVEAKTEATRGPPAAEGKASRETKYWHPNLTKAEWELLDRRMDRELESSGNYFNDATKWLYASEKGTKVFAMYGVGDGTVATPLYASGGQIAVRDYEKLQKFMEGRKNGSNTRRTTLDRLLADITRERGGAVRGVSDAGHGRADAGDVQVSVEKRNGDGGRNSVAGKTDRETVTGKASRELGTEYAPTFYSQMERVVEGVKQEKLGAASVVSMLRGKGVKAEEIKWSGIETFLEGKKSVTKQELLDYYERRGHP